MNVRILAVLLVVLGLSVGIESQLACQKKGYMEIEKFSEAVNCAAGELCFTSTAFKGVMKFYKKGCRLASDKCPSTSKDTIFGMSYTVNTDCCSINLCNQD